jgi:hypothetical protein
VEGYSRRYFVLTEQMFEYWAPPKVKVNICVLHIPRLG